MKPIILNTDKFYIEYIYNTSETSVYIDRFEIKSEYRHKKLSYDIWKDIQNKFKMDIQLIAFQTLIPYYVKMGFENLGEHYEGYYDFILRHK